MENACPKIHSVPFKPKGFTLPESEGERDREERPEPV